MMTLAAEAFQARPNLRAAAEESSLLEELRQPGRHVSLDGRTLYLVEGDLLFDEDELMFYALQKEAQQRARDVAIAPSPVDGTAALVGVGYAGKLVRWKPGTVLGYCVLRDTFLTPVQYELVTKNMKQATDAWTDTCGIEFHHFSEHDAHGDPGTRPDEIAPGVVFTVRHIDAGGRFIASAFFPTYPPARRRVMIDPSYFADTLRFDRVGVLRHELGHTLGFRHEHIRSNAPAACPDEDTTDTINLTDYDPQSVMHYFCGAVGSPELAITEIDRAGAQKVYGPPFSSLHLVE